MTLRRSGGSSASAPVSLPEITTPRELFCFTLGFLVRMAHSSGAFPTGKRSRVWVSYMVDEGSVYFDFYKTAGNKITCSFVLNCGEVKLTSGSIPSKAGAQADYIQFIAERLKKAGTLEREYRHR